jgi:hypothetical protein
VPPDPHQLHLRRQGAQGQRWSPSAAEPEWYIWLATPKVICTAAQYTVRMDPAVPTPTPPRCCASTATCCCARASVRRQLRLRAPARLTFRLSAIVPAPPANGAPHMVGMVFESDRDTRVRVAVRKHRGEYAAWNVNCD